MIEGEVRIVVVEESLKRKWKIWVAIAGIIVAAIGIGVALRPDEPVYRGKAFSRWYAELELNSTDLIGNPWDTEPGQAIVACGTNGVPWLLGEFQRYDSRWRRTFLNWQALILNRTPLGEEDGALKASRCLRRLGTNAASAVPIFCTVAKNTNSAYRHEAISFIGFIHGHADIAVPALAEILEDRLVSEEAMKSLEMFGEGGKPAIPALVRVCNDPTVPKKLQYAAMLTIAKINEAAK